MNIASIILIATDPSFINGSYILLSNNVSTPIFFGMYPCIQLRFLQYVAIIGVVFATIWTRRQNWNRHDSPNSKSGLGPHAEKANNNPAFDPAVPQTTKISTLNFGGAGRTGDSEFETSEGTQMSPSTESGPWKEKEGGSYDDIAHEKSEKEKSGWSEGVPSTTATAV